ncbi:unnamed protein product [Citrullus colocynthis]|uniref:Uncharacterized protein n=1 Tax=Citrullus colocynthis TaxID=252529 RepID=A0ABP0XNS3_9ROSI
MFILYKAIFFDIYFSIKILFEKLVVENGSNAVHSSSSGISYYTCCGFSSSKISAMGVLSYIFSPLNLQTPPTAVALGQEEFGSITKELLGSKEYVKGNTSKLRR